MKKITLKKLTTYAKFLETKEDLTKKEAELYQQIKKVIHARKLSRNPFYQISPNEMFRESMMQLALLDLSKPDEKGE